MSLTLALQTARSSLQATSAQIAVSGRNVSGANDPGYSRKIAATSTTADGGVRIVTVTRSADAALYFKMIGTTSSAAGQQALLKGLDALNETIGSADDATSPSARLGALQNALGQYANQPDDVLFARAALAAAKDMASTLNAATSTVQAVRAEADSDIATSVGRVNDLLAKFQTLNSGVVKGTFAGADVTDLMDQRDGIIAQLSEEMGITVVSRANNDMALYTDSGVTLFETTARSVTFAATPTYTPGTTGNAVYVDGVPVTGATATMPLHSGKLAGATELRDDIAVTYQTQLDEMARGLVAAFAETDQSGGGGATAAGLFTYPGGPAVPGAAVTGLAGTITVNAAVDPAAGGTLTRLRDGGINGAAYVYNTSGAASFSTRLDGLVGEFDASRTFDASAGLTASGSLNGFATGSVSWLQATRQSVSTTADYQITLLARTSEALSNATGVNMDEEYATQLQLEQSFAASSKLITVIGELFDTLLGAVR